MKKPKLRITETSTERQIGAVTSAPVKNEATSMNPILPNVTLGVQTGLFGCIDVFGKAGLSGWFFNAEFAEPRPISIIANGIPVGKTYARTSREDISTLLGTEVRSGFAFDWASLDTGLLVEAIAEMPSTDLIFFTAECEQSRRPIFQNVLCSVEKGTFLAWVDAAQNSATLERTGFEYVAAHPPFKKLYNEAMENRAHVKQGTVAYNMRIRDIRLESRKIVAVVTLENDRNPDWSAVPGLEVYLSGLKIADVESSDLLADVSLERNSRKLVVKVDQTMLADSVKKIDFYVTGINIPINAQPFLVGPNIFDTQLEYIGAGRLVGSFSERTFNSAVTTVQLVINSTETFEVKIGNYSHIKPTGRPSPSGFDFLLPSKYLDGKSVKVELYHDGKRHDAAFATYNPKGHLDLVTPDEFAGWIYDSSVQSGKAPFNLDIFIDDILVEEVCASLDRTDVGRPCGFHVNISEYTSGKSSFSLSAKVSGSSTCVLDTPVVHFRSDGVIELLRQLAVKAREGSLGLTNNDEVLLCQYLTRNMVNQFRQNQPHHWVTDSRLPMECPGVSIIVPVYDGLAETMRCLDSLFESRLANITEFHVVLVDDCGPQPAMLGLLENYASANQRVTLITNERNLGFVKSVNKALQLCSGKDVVLLNADAVVNSNWLDRMKNAAYSSKTVASVTPFSNNATICSYPDPLLENSMPEDISLSEIDEICKSVNAGKSIEIPSGIGFCMYMRAAAIREVGILDAERFGHGYGEENDWCIRARDLGWKHLHLCDTFVEHIGGVSFGQDKKSSLVDKNLRILAGAYPEYTPIVMDYLSKDPARLARNKITMKRIFTRTADSIAKTLYITHSFGGGIEVFCNDQAKRLRNENAVVVTLESLPPNKLAIRYADLEAIYSREDEYSALVEDLRLLGLSDLHFNSDIGFDELIWNLPDSLLIPFDVTIHDYTAVCPRVNFVTAAGNYCGEPSSASSCNKCIERDGAYPYLESRFKKWGSDIGRWRAFYNEKMRRARNIFTPDEDATKRMIRYFPQLNITSKPHFFDGLPSSIPHPSVVPGDVLRVGVIGAIGPHKGINLLEQCIKDAHQNDLPIHFSIIGYTSNDALLSTYPNVTITGKYEQSELQQILRAEGIDVALFISPWPETYSYTLSESLKAGLWPVALPIGAQASRIEKLGFGTVLPSEASASKVNRILMKLASITDQVD